MKTSAKFVLALAALSAGFGITAVSKAMTPRQNDLSVSAASSWSTLPIQNENLFPTSLKLGFNDGGKQVTMDESGTITLTEAAQYTFYGAALNKIDKDATYVWSMDIEMENNGQLNVFYGNYVKPESVWASGVHHLELVFQGSDLKWPTVDDKVIGYQLIGENVVKISNSRIAYSRTGSNLVNTASDFAWLNVTVNNREYTFSNGVEGWYYGLTPEAEATYLITAEAQITKDGGGQAQFYAGSWNDKRCVAWTGTAAKQITIICTGAEIATSEHAINMAPGAGNTVVLRNLEIYKLGAPDGTATLTFEGAKGDGYMEGDFISISGVWTDPDNKNGTVNTDSVNDENLNGTFVEWNPDVGGIDLYNGIPGSVAIVSGQKYALSFHYKLEAGKKMVVTLTGSGENEEFVGSGKWEEFYHVFSTPTLIEGKGYVCFTSAEACQFIFDQVTATQVTFPVTKGKAIGSLAQLPIVPNKSYVWMIDGSPIDITTIYPSYLNKTATLKEMDISPVVKGYADSFLNDLHCDDGVTPPSPQIWAELGDAYDALQPEAKTTIRRVNKNLDYADETLQAVKNFKERYAYILDKYGTKTYSDFLATGASSFAAAGLFMPSNSSTTAMFLVGLAALGMISLSAIFFVRKKQS